MVNYEHMTHIEEHEWELTPKKLAQMKASGIPVRIIDVRETNEYNHCRIDEAELIPMGSLPDAMSSLSKDDYLVFY